MNNNNSEDLLKNQYQNSANLNARTQIHTRFSVSKIPWHGWVFDRFNLKEGSQVLEIGCGPGKLWLENKDRLPANCAITLTDFSPGMIEEARSNLNGGPFDFQVANAQELPFPDQSFEIVVANHMLYHVPDRAKALSEIRRVLRPGGYFFAATNGEGHMGELKKLNARFIPGVEYIYTTDDFKLENGREQLIAWFSDVTLQMYDNNLNVTEVEPIIAYILSSDTAKAILDNLPDKAQILAEITSYLEQEIATRGGFKITKETGLFIAH